MSMDKRGRFVLAVRDRVKVPVIKGVQAMTGIDMTDEEKMEYFKQLSINYTTTNNKKSH